MRSRSHIGVKPALACAVAFAVAAGCVSSNAEDSPGTLSPPTGTGGHTATIFDGGNSGGRLNDGAVLSVLCGQRYDCESPDNPLACKDKGHKLDGGPKGFGGASAGGRSGSGGFEAAGGSAGAHLDAGRLDASGPRDAASDVVEAGNASDSGRREGGAVRDVFIDRSEGDHTAPSADASGDSHGDESETPGSDVNAPPPVDAGPVYGCQVAAQPTGTGGASSRGDPFYQCLPAGTGKSGSPCYSAAECRPGLACAGVANTGNGLCLPYCCDPTTSCDKAWVAGGGQDVDSGQHHYCGERALIEGTQGTALRVPVCVRADQCTLDEHYPCTGSSCICREGTACTVTVLTGDGGNDVRGTTVCAPVGKGRTGDRCPCAAGYFCSQSTSLCLKMCRTDPRDSACDPGKCQATVGFPDGWGICVGPAPAAK